jgi:hypothetical protein
MYVGMLGRHHLAGDRQTALVIEIGEPLPSGFHAHKILTAASTFEEAARHTSLAMMAETLKARVVEVAELIARGARGDSRAL